MFAALLIIAGAIAIDAIALPSWIRTLPAGPTRRAEKSDRVIAIGLQVLWDTRWSVARAHCKRPMGANSVDGLAVGDGPLVGCGAIHSKVLKRAQFVPLFANRPSSHVPMEPPGSAHYWARVLARLGHNVRLIAAQFVRPLVKFNKNDAADAAAIWEAAQRPGMRFVADGGSTGDVRAAPHTPATGLNPHHADRSAPWIALRIWRCPAARSTAIYEAAKGSLASLADQFPAMLTGSTQDQLSRLRALDEQIARIEQRILEWRRNDDACRRISEIPGVGVLTATAAVSVIGQRKTFRSGREFAAYLGLVPRQNGSGGRVKLGGISKRGDVYLLLEG